MSTNYYLHRREASCPHCHRAYEPLHIGKSSVGWCFALRVFPNGEGGRAPKSLEDWKVLWSNPEYEIRDSYGIVLSDVEMLSKVVGRPRDSKRHDLRDGVSHGEGTYDLVGWEFL